MQPRSPARAPQTASSTRSAVWRRFSRGDSSTSMIIEWPDQLPSVCTRRSLLCCIAVSCEYVIFAYAKLVTMRPLARIIMLWIMIVSLPLQGIAATIGLPCTMAHALVSNAATETADACDDAAMVMPIQHDLTRQDQAGAKVEHEDAPCDQHEHGKGSSCHACSACWIGASAPPPFAVPGQLPGPHTSLAFSSITSHSGWIPSRLERPPRG